MTKIYALIRIAGKVNRSKDIEDTLDKLKLRRKYACTIYRETKEIMGMIKKVRSFIAYGEIDQKILVEIIKKRGQIDVKSGKSGKIDAEKISEHFIKSGSFQESGIKPFFRLAPPRGGINSKQHFPLGVLGEHKDKINKLIERML